jgi:hypothetical protein
MRRPALLAVSAAFAAGAFAGNSLHPRPPAVRSPYEVAGRLHARGVAVRVVHPPAPRLFPEVYLTTTARTWDELQFLPWLAAAAARWRGTVFCRRVPPGCQILDEDPEHVLLTEDLACYGDPDLLRQVADSLR